MNCSDLISLQLRDVIVTQMHLEFDDDELRRIAELMMKNRIALRQFMRLLVDSK